MPPFFIVSWMLFPGLSGLTPSIRQQLWCMSLLYAWIWVWCGCVCLRVHLVYPSQLPCHIRDPSGCTAWQRCACVLPFRLLQELSVADGEVSEMERTAEASGGRLRRALSPLGNGGNSSGGGRGLITPEESALLVQRWAVFNKGLTTRCKWCVIHKEPLMARALCFGLGLSNIYQLLKSTLSVIN